MLVAALIGDSDAAMRAAADLEFDIEAIRPDHLRAMVLTVVGDSDSTTDFATGMGATRIRRIPSDFALVLRTMLLLNNLSHRLAPGRRLDQGDWSAPRRRRAGRAARSAGHDALRMTSIVRARGRGQRPMRRS